LRKEQFPEAISELQKAIELEPDEVMHVRAMGFAYLLKGEYNIAEEWFQKALKMDSDDPDTYDVLFELYVATGNLEEAEGMASKEKTFAKKPRNKICASFHETLVKLLSKKEYDETLNELLALMKQGEYFNLKDGDFRVIERAIDSHTLDPERTNVAKRLVQLVKGEIDPRDF